MKALRLLAAVLVGLALAALPFLRYGVGDHSHRAAHAEHASGHDTEHTWHDDPGPTSHEGDAHE